MPGARTSQDAAGERRVEPARAPGVELYSSKRLARLILLTVLSGFLAVELINLTASPIRSTGATLAIGIVAICVTFALQVLISAAGAAAWPLRLRMAMLAAMALITYFPLIVLGKQWGSMAGFLAGSVLLLIPGRIAWLLFGAVIASMLGGALALHQLPYGVAYLTVASLDAGLVVFALSRLTLIIADLHATRAELAELAVIRERARFARDLHDLLGYSLSAITLKAEVTRRAVTSSPGRAKEELAEILDISRQALADVRLVASGYRHISLAKEADSVASLLSTAGIAAQVHVGCVVLDETTDTVLATVLREAVTNLLRHSAAQHCTIEASESAGTIRLLVRNDGVPAGAASDRDGGGLENLATRLAAVGGQLVVHVSGGWFELRATVPSRIFSNR